MVQQLSQQWSEICIYIELTSQWQEFQKVKGHVSIILAMYWSFFVKNELREMFVSASRNLLMYHC